MNTLGRPFWELSTKPWLLFLGQEDRREPFASCASLSEQILVWVEMTEWHKVHQRKHLGLIYRWGILCTMTADAHQDKGFRPIFWVGYTNHYFFIQLSQERPPVSHLQSPILFFSPNTWLFWTLGVPLVLGAPLINNLSFLTVASIILRFTCLDHPREFIS